MQTYTSEPIISYLCTPNLSLDSLALAGIIPRDFHRPHDAGTGIPVDRSSRLPNWHHHHLLGVQTTYTITV